MKLIFASAFLISAIPTLAFAQTFTVTGSGQAEQQVMGTAGGRAVGAVYSTGSGTSTFASGKKVVSKNRCMQWTPDPGSQFSGVGVCNVEDKDGTYSVFFSCQNDTKTMSSDCWGGLIGATGAYANKTGTASWHSKGSSDNKTLTFAGAGLWNE